MTTDPIDFTDSGKSEQELRDIAAGLPELQWCNRCIGRLFARCGRGFENTTRGTEFLIKYGNGAAPGADGSVVEEDACTLCDGIFLQAEQFAEIVQEDLETVECDSFLVGSVIDYETADREKEIAGKLELDCTEPLKSEMNRTVGKPVSERTGIPVEFGTPDVVAILDARFGTVELQITPLFIRGRYRKLVRDIPQTKWFCRKCRGKGCSYCSGTGKMYETSVEELIGAPALEAFKAEEHFFHGMGREDIDALMLGTGRPFILELRNPHKRSADLPELQDAVNKSAAHRVEIEGLRNSERSAVAALKNARTFKTYQVTVEFASDVTTEKLKSVMGCFSGKRIDQRTPARVAHRRANRVRQRTAYSMTGALRDERTAVLEIKGEAGIYIKELVSGDNGRTKPSVAELMGVPCNVTALDVIRIHDDESPGPELDEKGNSLSTKTTEEQ